MRKNRVAIYCRCSTAQQSLEIQLHDLRTYSDARKFNLVEIFEEVGVSGSKQARPELNKLLKLVRQRKVEYVLIWKLDRLGRNTSHLLSMIDEFESLGISLISFQETIDLSTPIGKVMVTVLSALSAFERDTLRERVIAGIENARRKGIKLGRPKLNLIKEIQQLRSKGKTYRQISSNLNVSHGYIANALKS
jgi:DNA invertase Pin-like site-specific DNA recombinase